MTPFFLRLLVLAAVLGSLLNPAKAGAIMDGDPGDAMVTSTAVNNAEYDHIYHFEVGALYSGDSASMVEGFALPYLAPGQQVTNATFSVFLEGQNAQSGVPNYNLQLYGLKRVSTANGIPVVADAYTGTNDTANTLLSAKFVTPSTTVNQEVAYTGANLASFVQAQYANSAFSGMDLSPSRFIFLRVSPDAFNTSYNNYIISNARNPLRANHPNLALTISNGISNIAGRLQFSFNLPQSAITSAGVYNTSTGKLLRTLWNNVKYQQGTNYGVWDGNDDSGAALAAGTNYQIKLIYHNVQYIFEGMIGNTSSTHTGANIYHSFSKIHDMTITGNTAYYTVGYNELEANFHQFTVGNPQAPSEVNFGYSFADPYSCEYLVTSDATRTYWAKVYGGISASDTYVVAITNSNHSFYTFPQGKVPSGNLQNFQSCCDFDATAGQVNPAYGLAVQKTGNYLFVSHSNLNLVRVFDKVQGNQVGSFTVPSPTRMATTANGDVWIISNSSTPAVMRYTFANGTATLDQTLSGLTQPAGVGVSADDSLVLVADGGASQQVKAFNNSNGTPAFTYGNLGGMAVNGPNVTTNTFEFSTQEAGANDFENEAFIAFQPDNTFWVSDGGNGRILHYSISNNTLTYIEQIAFNDTSYRATVDVTDATRVFNAFMEYSVNYSLPLGGTNGSWKAVKNWAYQLPNDATHYYYGFANGFNNVVTLSNGRTYGLLLNFASGAWDLFELPASGPLRYTGYTFYHNVRMYEDGTLRFNVTAAGNAALSFYSQPLTGFDANNNPVWGSPALLGSTALGTGDPVPWVAFIMRTELTASGILPDFDAYQGDSGFHLAGLQKGTSSFQWRSSPSTNSTVSGWFPQDGKFDTGNGVQYAGNIAMAQGRNIVYGYHGEFWGGGQASQWVNFLDNGLMVGLFGTFESGANMGSASVDGFAGNSFSPTLVKGPDGNTYLYHNDECNHGGTCQWRINGWDGIAEISGTGTVGSTTALGTAIAGPVVSVTSPTAGASYLNGNNLVLSASIGGTGAAITSVQFFDGSTSLGVVTNSTYTLDYSGLSAGTHSITAQATDANGNSTTSAAVSITIGADGTNSPAPAPISLTVGTLASSSVPMHWTQPASSTTSSTIGQIISFQCDNPNDSNALSPSTVAGAPSYAVPDFNVVGQTTIAGPVYENLLNSLGQTISNLGINFQMAGSGNTNSTQSLTGSAVKLFGGEVNTTFNTSVAMTVSNIPYASYDVVVYALPGNISSGSQTTAVTVGDGAFLKGTVTQNFNQMPTTYSVAKVAAGTSSTVTNVNAVVFQGLTSPSLEVQGSNIAAFQIVERPYDQGAPASYSIERATGTGAFAVIGTTSGTTLSYTDSNAVSGTAYQYRVQAINSYGSSAYSNTIAVTTPGTTTSTAPVSNFTSWQSKYFTTAQLTDATVSGAGADPYGSGVPNLLAYALQLDPSTATPANIPTPFVANGHLQIAYFVPTSITDINYIVEVSTDLKTWNSGTGYTTVLSTVTNTTGHTYTVQDALPTTAVKHFMRLRVTQH